MAGEDFALIGDHQDGWYGEGALDNAAGNACMLELARVFAQQAQARTLVRLLASMWSPT